MWKRVQCIAVHSSFLFIPRPKSDSHLSKAPLFLVGTPITQLRFLNQMNQRNGFESLGQGFQRKSLQLEFVALIYIYIYIVTSCYFEQISLIQNHGWQCFQWFHLIQFEEKCSLKKPIATPGALALGCHLQLVIDANGDIGTLILRAQHAEVSADSNSLEPAWTRPGPEIFSTVALWRTMLNLNLARNMWNVTLSNLM